MRNNIDEIFPVSEFPLSLIHKSTSKQSSVKKIVFELKETGKEFNNILDLGCGNGNSIDYIQILYPNINWVGVDLTKSPEVESRIKKIENICSYDGEKLPFKSKSFDIIYSRQVFEHVLNPYNLLNEVSRVSRKGAFFIGSVSQMEPYHSYSIFNWTPYALNEFLKKTGFILKQIRPGVDVFTLVFRSLFLTNTLTKYLESESPINRMISLIGYLLKKNHCSVNSIKLKIAGHVCFIAEKV